MGKAYSLPHEPVLQVHFSPDGNFLYTGARRDPDILCWDVRSPTEPLYRLQRSSEGTNQRIQFTIEPVGRHLATGGAQVPVHANMLPAVIASRWGPRGLHGVLQCIASSCTVPVQSPCTRAQSAHKARWNCRWAGWKRHSV